ncbi:MAG: site-specific integrase [Caldisericota bacterium]|nr:site-specific integrase [Caldisericota bacterium]
MNSHELKIIESEQLQGTTEVATLAAVKPHDDERALAGWLGFLSLGNDNTFRSYRKEAFRFRMFLETIHAQTPGRSTAHLMRDATEIDVKLYEAHLRGRLKDEPLVPLRVPDEILRRYGRQDQPFLLHFEVAGVVMVRPLQLKASSVNLALSVLHALYQYWLKPDPETKLAYVGANPVRRVKGSTNRVQRQSNRNFPIEALQAMMQTLDAQATQVQADGELAGRDAQLKRIARRRWVIALLFGLWGRRAEIAGLTMDQFSHDGKRWTVLLHRKGGHDEVVVVAPWVMQELTRYRKSLGLSPIPHKGDGEGMPVLAKLRDRPGNPGAAADDLVYREVQAVAADAAAALRANEILVDLDSVDREIIASRLDGVTPHWFRHAGASIAINTGAMSLETASKMLGHSSVAVTSAMYFHADEQAMEDGMQRLGAQAFGAG